MCVLGSSGSVGDAVVIASVGVLVVPASTSVRGVVSLADVAVGIPMKSSCNAVLESIFVVVPR